MRAILVVALGLMLVACSDEGPWDGPFGTKSGLTKEQLEEFAVLQFAGGEEGVTAYKSLQAPRPSHAVSEYEYVFNSNGSICYVRGSLRPEHARDELSAVIKGYSSPVVDGSFSNWSAKSHKMKNGLQVISAYVSSDFSGNIQADISFYYNSECE